MANCHDLFLSFHEAIGLSESKKERLRQARDAIRDRIKKKFAEAKRTPVPQFVAQGSYAMHTIVTPLDGEYDIDDGIYLQHLDKKDDRDWPTPETVHRWVFDAVLGRTDQDPIDKRTCIRVMYAGQYHVDLPIYCELNGLILHAERGENGWHKSDPQKITEWFMDSASRRGDQLRRMVGYFKAWADWNSRNGKLPSGLILTVLVVEKFAPHERDDVCFGQLATAVYTRILSTPYVYNPTDAAEDFYAQYDDVQKKRFIVALRRLKDTAADALSSESKIEACKSWRGELGERWIDCDKLQEDDKPRYTKGPAILKDDARSA